MLAPLQRWIVFIVFCIATLVFLSLEAYLIWSVIDNGLTVGKGIGTLLNAGGLAGCGVLFHKLIEMNFLNREILPMARLRGLASGRNVIIRRNNQDIYGIRRELVTNVLRFAEETLRGWIPGSHLELCVFVDAEQPILFGYYDSNGDTTARSMSERARNPNFYTESGYEVTKLLRNPTSQPRILADTHDSKTGYVFTTSQQRTQLRSTLLLCLDLETPCALVISSNKENSLTDSDEKLISFIRYVGEMVRFDLFNQGFLCSIRTERPDLFVPVALPVARSREAGNQAS
jgi:hypothetical protein